jgi:hypothetical protein
MSYVMSQSVKDSIADAQTLEWALHDPMLEWALHGPMMDWCSRKITKPEWYSPEVLAWMAETDAKYAFQACPGLR